MSATISTSGRVCLSEWTGPVTVTMMVALLSVVRRLRATEERPLLLLLRVNVPAAKVWHAMEVRSSRYFQHFLGFATKSRSFVTIKRHFGAIRRVVTDAGVPLTRALNKPVSFFDLLDEAFKYSLDAFPHEILELRRRRIRSGAWPTAETTGAFDEKWSGHGDYG